jgi:hypothetical protein
VGRIDGLALGADRDFAAITATLEGLHDACLASEGNGNLLVVDNGSGNLLRVDLKSGNRSVTASTAVGSGPLIQSGPEFIALQVNPQLPLIAPRRLSDGRFQFSFAGTGATNYTIQFSTNLINWSTLTNVTASGEGTNLIIDPDAPTNIRRFYRAVFVP